jgi:plastocyanin
MIKSRFAIAAAVVLGCLPLLGAAPATAVQPIRLYSFGYSPSPIVLTAGQPVTLQFTSTGSHDFTAPAFFAASRILSGRVEGGEVDIKAGEIKNVTLIPARGAYKAHCGHPFHKMMGMHTDIVVR